MDKEKIFFPSSYGGMEVVEDFNPEDTSDIESVRQQAIEYMQLHDMPVGMLTLDDPVTFLEAHEPIDIIL
ncbi:MAG: hypothetical protein J6Y84_04550 [Bacteroidaceae bacterium]|nr:hypothetical protein [Bacteroidaceae bacterium]